MYPLRCVYPRLYPRVAPSPPSLLLVFLLLLPAPFSVSFLLRAAITAAASSLGTTYGDLAILKNGCSLPL